MSVNRTPYQGGYGSSQHGKNPYEQNFGGGKEDIRWLFLDYIYNNNNTLWLIKAYLQD